MSQPGITPTAATTNMEVGPDNIPIPSTLTGKNVNLTYAALKTPSPITLSNRTPTQLPVSPGPCTIQNPLGNGLVAVGGLAGNNDQPYFIPGQTGVAKGTIIHPGSSAPFLVTDSSLLSVIAQRNGDIIMVTGNLSQSNYATQISDPAPDPSSLPPFAVVSTVPANNAMNVSTSQVIEIVFNRQIGSVSVALADVALVPGVPTLRVYIDPTNSSQLDIDPKGSNLAPGTQYTVTLSATPPDITDNNGTAMLSPYSFQFTVGVPPPPPTPLTVSSVTPGSNTTGVAINTTVVVLLTAPVVSSGVTTSNVQLVQVGGSAVTAPVSLGSDNKTITITPSSSLSFSTQYKVVVQNLVSLQGVNQSPSPWDGVSQADLGTFTTSSTVTVNTVTPGNNATGVPINTTVVVLMSAQVKSAQVTTANVQLIKLPSTTVTCTVVLGGDQQTITITPSANLTPSSQYKVVVQNLQTLASVTQVPNPWDGAGQGPGAGEFTTLAPPTVSSVTPGSATTGVAITSTVAVLMSQTMQSAGVTTSNVKLIKVSGGTTVTSTVSLGSDQQTITITPTSSLAYNTEYKVTVANLVGTDGVTMSPTPWDGVSQGPNAGAFTTIAQPTVVSVTPGNNATGVTISTAITIVMSQPILSGGVTSSNVQLYLASNNTLVPSSVSLGPDNETITMTPTSHLAYSTQYYVVVQNLASVAGGITQSPNPWNGSSQGPGAGEFTTGAATYTQIYTVSGNPSPCGSSGAGWEPSNGNICSASQFGIAASGVTNTFYSYGETASSANGLVGKVINKIVLPTIAGTSSAFIGSQSPPTGTLKVQIISSSGTLQYTFLSTFTSSSTGFVSLCNLNCGGGTASFSGWNNIILTDTANTYVMQTGDAIVITFSGSNDNNVITVLVNSSGPYGNAVSQSSSSSSPTNQSGIDLAATMYSAS